MYLFDNNKTCMNDKLISHKIEDLTFGHNSTSSGLEFFGFPSSNFICTVIKVDAYTCIALYVFSGQQLSVLES